MVVEIYPQICVYFHKILIPLNTTSKLIMEGDENHKEKEELGESRHCTMDISIEIS